MERAGTYWYWQTAVSRRPGAGRIQRGGVQALGGFLSRAQAQVGSRHMRRAEVVRWSQADGWSRGMVDGLVKGPEVREEAKMGLRDTGGEVGSRDGVEGGDGRT